MDYGVIPKICELLRSNSNQVVYDAIQMITKLLDKDTRYAIEMVNNHMITNMEYLLKRVVFIIVLLLYRNDGEV